MQTKNFLLLAALSTSATVGSLALAFSAEAVLYNVNATLADGGTIKGSFNYENTGVFGAFSLEVEIVNTLFAPLDGTYSSTLGDTVGR